jgi:hypothetical protein
VAIDLPDIRGRIRIDTSDLDRAQRKLSELNRTFATFGGDAEKGFGRADKAQREFAKGSDDSAKANKRNSDSLFEVVKAGALMAGAMKAIKFPAMIAGVNLAAQAFKALAAGGIAFISAIAPAAGAVAALPGLMSAAAQAMGVTKLATAGLKDELKALQKAAGEPFVPQATKDFAKFLFDMQPLLNQLRDTAAKGLFPGLEAGLTGLKKLFPEVEAAVGATATKMGELAKRAGEMAGAGVFRRDFGILAKANVEIIDRLGTAAIFLTDALRQVLVAASPMTVAFAGAAESLARYIARAVGAEEANEKMAKFFERTQAVLESLGRIIVNVGRGLFNVFKGGAELGAEMLASLERITAQFAEWTSSVSGQNAIKKFFDDARQPLKEIGLLIRDIAQGFGNLSSSLDLGEVISQIRTELLPPLKELMDTSGKLFTQELITLAGKFIETLSKFGSESGALTTFVKTLGNMLDVINKLAEIPGFTEFVATMGILRGTMAAFKFAGFITGASQLGPLILTMSTRLGGLMTALRGVSLMLLTPPLGIVVALGALVAALIYAYNESETFRRFVDESFAAVKVAVATAVDAVIGFLQKMVAFWFNTADMVLTAAEVMFGWMDNGLGDKVRAAREHFDSFRAKTEEAMEKAKVASEGWKNKTIGDFIAIGNKVNELPPVKSIPIEAVDHVTPTIQRIQDALAGLKDKTVHVRSIYTDSGDLGAKYGRHSGGPVYHAGGHVQAFHGGGLKGDEVSAKLLVGEFVLNRATTKALGAAGLAQLNASGGKAGMGGNTYNVTVQGNWDFTNPNVEYAIGEKIVKAIKRVEGSFD